MMIPYAHFNIDVRLPVLQYHLYTALPGEFVGVLAVVTGEPSFFNVKATKQCHVVIISKANFYR